MLVFAHPVFWCEADRLQKERKKQELIVCVCVMCESATRRAPAGRCRRKDNGVSHYIQKWLQAVSGKHLGGVCCTSRRSTFTMLPFPFFTARSAAHHLGRVRTLPQSAALADGHSWHCRKRQRIRRAHAQTRPLLHRFHFPVSGEQGRNVG